MTRARGFGRLLWCVCCLALLLLSFPAEAELKQSAIALVSGGANGELHARLRAELHALGWRVREVSSAADSTLDEVARRAATLAVLRVDPRGEHIEIWVAKEVDASVGAERVAVDPVHPELAVLRSVETVRARFLELGISPENATPPPAPAEAPPRVIVPVKAPAPSPLPLPLPAPQDRGVWIDLGAGVSSISPRLEVRPAFSGSVRYVPRSFFAADLSVALSPFSATLRDASLATKVWFHTAGLAAELRHSEASYAAGIGLGAALAVIDLQGESSEDAVGKRVRLVTALPFLRASTELALNRAVRVRFEGLLGLTAPRAVVGFLGEPVASLGRPWFGARLAFALRPGAL